MPVYATQSDYYDFLGVTDPGGNDLELTARLRRASSQIASYTRTARYEVNAEGAPTDEKVVEALRDATCAQAAYWDTTDDITGGEAVAGPVKIGSVSLGGTAVGGASSRTAADTRRSDEAIIILRNAGLITTATAHT